ncbi:MAG: 30S ribosomal protein S5 [Candidatus Peribacteria bacterium]|jgi:small subunit ribosomal protein S5|nr:30S ribosomal protein S5 [Candidatus Peribacteria bacterium]
MTPENITPTAETLETPVVEAPISAEIPETAGSTDATSEKGFSRERRGGRNNDRRGERRDRGEKREKTKKEFDELLLEVRRVTRVTTGGRRMSFRATILVGNKKGKIGLGISKGNDVAGAVSKATNEAYKALFEVPITKGDTVPYPLELKYKSARVRLLPASQGTGLKAGSSIRSVLELAGYSNILSKMIGSNNKLNNALATIQALASYKHADYFTGLREIKEEETSAVVKQEEEKNSETTTEKQTLTKKTAAPKAVNAEKREEKKPVEKKPTPKKAPVKKES